MKQRRIMFFLLVLLATTVIAEASEFDYGDYVEAINTPDGNIIYIYKSSIKQSGKILTLKAIETKNGLIAPKSGEGDPYIAIKYSFKYDCSNKKYAGGPTTYLQIENGWISVYPDEVKVDENSWRDLPKQNTFVDILPAFCNKK